MRVRKVCFALRHLSYDVAARSHSLRISIVAATHVGACAVIVLSSAELVIRSMCLVRGVSMLICLGCCRFGRNSSIAMSFTQQSKSGDCCTLFLRLRGSHL